MLTKKTENNLTVIQQIPVLLFFCGAAFSLPLTVAGLVNTFLLIDLESNLFLLLFGLGLGWLFLEFVALREEIRIDSGSQELCYFQKGLFRVKQRQINLANIDKVVLEKDRSRGKARFNLLLVGDKADFLINNPSVVYLDHFKTAVLISETLNKPLETTEKFR